MAIIRGQIDFSAHFTQVPNEWVRDANLSHRARGVLLVLMSHRSGWEVTTEHLIRNGTEGRDAIRTAIRELVDQGYLQREQVRDGDSARASGSRYVLTGKPLSDGFPGAQKSDMGGSGFSGAQKPVAQKSATKNTNSKKTKGQEDQEKSAPDGDAPAELELALPPEATPPEEAIAKRAYDATDGALKFMAIKAIAKWALERKNATPERVEQAIADLHHRGKPVTRATVDQQLTGAFDRQPWRQDNNQRMAAARKQATRQQAALAALEGGEGQS